MRRKIILILLCGLFLGIAGYSGIRLYRAQREYREGENAYKVLTQYVHTEASFDWKKQSEDRETVSADEKQEAPADETNWPVVDFKALQEINPDVTAWILIEGTDIHYPVVQGKDNEYYLRRLIDGSQNNAGSIFMDYRNEKTLTDRNTVLYGHNMQDGSMFKPIADYKEQLFYDDHPTGLIMTPNGNWRVEFFAGYVTDLNSQAWKLEFASDEEFGLWLADAVSRSTFTSPIEPTPQDRVVTLSTCTYEYSDARYVLVGVLK